MSNTRATRAASASRTTRSQTRLRVSSPEDILAAIPYVLGFHPADSLVVLGIGGSRLRVQFTCRADLPTAGDEHAAERTADYVAEVLAAQHVGQAILVAYGSEARARLAIDHTRDALHGRDIGVREALRADEGRYWSYECTNPSCCPTEGTPHDIGSSVVAATATAAGYVALPDRETLERSLAPIGGITGVSMRQATTRAEDRLENWAAGASHSAAVRQSMLEEGRTRVHSAVARFSTGNGKLSDDETASLSVLLKHLQVRDEAWLRIDEGNRNAHVDLWTYVTRRAESRYVPAPASLLSFAAWQDGNGALASIAVDRALQADPAYSMAQLMRDVLDYGVSPDGWEPPITAEELTGLYARSDGGVP